MKNHHILTVLVENRPGVLTRVAGLFARRGFNIFSLAVAPTEDERFSRITIVVDAESAPLEQIIKQLDKLINVVKIDELAPGEAVERELLLATVAASARCAGAGHRAGRGVRGADPERGLGSADRGARGAPGEAGRLREAARQLRDREPAAHRQGRVAQARAPHCHPELTTPAPEFANRLPIGTESTQIRCLWATTRAL